MTRNTWPLVRKEGILRANRLAWLETRENVKRHLGATQTGTYGRMVLPEGH